MPEYTVQIQTSGDDGAVWQSVHPAENVTLAGGLDDSGFLNWVADHQNLVTDGRIQAWQGHNADTGNEPDAVVWFGKWAD